MLYSMLRRLKHLFLGRAVSAKPVEMRTLPQYRAYSIGAYSYGDPTIFFPQSGAKLSIGNFCSIANDVRLMLGGEHRVDWVTTYPFMRVFDEARHFVGHPKTKGDIQIGSDVWIGRSATVLSGVTIGHGAVVAAASVVVKDVPPYAIVGGNPAKLIRHRFSESQIAQLLATQWWTWPIERIKQAMPLLLSPEIDEFLTLAQRLAADTGAAKKTL
jgi:virginiamycin A acetyltransferase